MSPPCRSMPKMQTREIFLNRLLITAKNFMNKKKSWQSANVKNIAKFPTQTTITPDEK